MIGDWCGGGGLLRQRLQCVDRILFKRLIADIRIRVIGVADGNRICLAFPSHQRICQGWGQGCPDCSRGIACGTNDTEHSFSFLCGGSAP
jgi:hypothetical protein